MSAHVHAQAKAVEPARAAPSPSLLVQRKCASCEHDADNDKALMQKRGAGQGGGGGLSLVDAALGSPGMPLDAGPRSHMENRFGRDFSHVRVRDDALAHDSARSVDALAYTVGNDVVFGAGQYRPHTPEGSHLLAHELAHTVQQGGLQRRAAGGALGTDPLPALEHEADRAADIATAPHAMAMPSLTRLSTPVLARATARNFTPNPDKSLPEGFLSSEAAVGGKKAFLLPVLELPAEKGEQKKIKAAWDAVAKAGALETVLGVTKAGRPRVKLKEARFGLGAVWAQKYNLDLQGLADGWSKVTAGGADLFTAKGAKGDKDCEIDHIVEQQFGGTSIPENLQLLEAGNNGTAGNKIFAKLRDPILALKADARHKNISEFTLCFVKATTEDGGCDACCAVEKEIKTLTDDGTLGRSSKDAKIGLTGLRLSAGGIETEIYLDSEKTPVDILESPVAENRMAAGLIVGLRLLRLHRDGAVSTITARFDERQSSRLPISFGDIKLVKPADDDKAPVILKLVAGKTSAGKKKAAAPGKNVADLTYRLEGSKFPKNAKFHYPYLSEGVIKTFDMSPDGFEGTGTITPSIPLIKQLDVTFSNDSLKVSHGLGLAQKTSKDPYFRITKDELGLELAPEFIPYGSIAFELGPQGKALANGTVTAGVQDEKFFAKGDLTAHIPGFKETKGEVLYTKENDWSGQVVIVASDFKNVEGAHATVTFGRAGMAIDGGFTVVLPGTGNKVDVTASYADGKFGLDGHSLVTLPFGDGQVEVVFGLENKKLHGSGKTKIHVLGQPAEIAVEYDDGVFSGSGSIKIQRGPATGTLAIVIDDKHKVTGSGTISYALTDKLTLTGGIELQKDDTIRVKGGLTVPGPVNLFEKVGGKKTLFTTPTIEIPIPGASIAGYGIVATIDGSIDIHYWIGPGQLLNTKLEAAFNPLASKKDLDVWFTSQLYVPANAGIGGSIRGGLGLDIGIASASGGLTVGATADLDGSAQAAFKGHYKDDNFSADAAALVEAGLTLGLSLDADVRAEVGVGPFKGHWLQVWKLAAWQYDTGLHFSMLAPLHYASNEPFKPPSLDDIKWNLPKLDPKALLDNAMNSSPPTETRK